MKMLPISRRLCTLAGALFLMAISTTGHGQSKTKETYVDSKGILRWGNGKEVCAFGVNYTAMFAHAYRTAKKMNIPLEKAIDDDVYHFSRLGFDAFRVHVWDSEISDTTGNLLANDNLRLFDYAIHKMKERGMKFVITPIAYWGNGFPEPDGKTPGFSTKFGKDACLTNPRAIAAQERYLAQFLDHVNSYTKVAYKNDPDVVAFEVSNEPHHRESAEKVIGFINRLVASMRSTGCTKPIFYNVSHSVHLAEAYYKSNIQGGTFQWYPTGLGARHELGGNLLPNVDRYPVVFAELPGYKKAAKIVYEFDAADVGRSYIYPAMARSFREAGMQFAAHFAYDPTFMAQFNTEYNTHYMNLAYAPQKALSLMIASEAFHQLPLFKGYGNYPDNASFGSFRVSYEQDLAEMVTANKFLYTNSTDTKPVDATHLEQIAGFGNSPVVSYDGTGAYFLDRLEPGVWRLEVMPDAIWIRDPFSRSTPHREVAITRAHEWPMQVNLTDVGADFTATALNEGNTHQPRVTGNELTVAPGAYLLVRKGATTKLNKDSRWKDIRLGEFSGPISADKPFAVHEPRHEVTANAAFTVAAQVGAIDDDVKSVELVPWLGRGRPQPLKFDHKGGYSYECAVPAGNAKEGYFQYYIVVTSASGSITFPGAFRGRPWDWDFTGEQPYRVRVVDGAAPLFLFDALTDADELARQWVRESYLVPSANPESAQLLVKVDKLFTPDPENKEKQPVYDYSFRYCFTRKVAGRLSSVAHAKKLLIRGRSLDGMPGQMQIALITKDGTAYGGVVSLPEQLGECEIALSDLTPVQGVSLPRPYPTFLPYYLSNKPSSRLVVADIESIQFSIGPGIPQSEIQGPQGVAVESVRLE